VSTRSVTNGGVDGHKSANCPVSISRTRILVVDDHEIVREGIAVLLERDHGMQIVGFAATGQEAVLAARSLKPDVIVMDLVLPALNGIDATRRIVDEHPQTHVIVLSACHTPEHVYRALRSGARGYVVKGAASTELLRAVRAVAAGDQYVAPALPGLRFGGSLATAIPQSPIERLSKREREVLQRIVAGATNVDIAQNLRLSCKTVETYRSRIMVKLAVTNREALVRLVSEYELPAA
jgi:DNA-binding NarL/FixJ family response regulator